MLYINPVAPFHRPIRVTISGLTVALRRSLADLERGVGEVVSVDVPIDVTRLVTPEHRQVERRRSNTAHRIRDDTHHFASQ